MTGGAVLLAAGFSRRFGSDKRRHRLPSGLSLLEASVQLYAQAFDRLVVVLRPEDDGLIDAAALAGNVTVELCSDAHLGMGHSLACGARAARDWSYLFVTLADMAWVSPDTLRQLRSILEAAAPDTIVQPTYQGNPGHPVGFGARHLPLLARSSGDAGARGVLAAAGERLIRVPVSDPGVLADLDTPPERGKGDATD